MAGRSHPAVTFQIPRPLTGILGRAHEIETVCRLLQDNVPLVTLVGPGGVGKTRLAQEIAWIAGAEFADGAVFVDLFPVQAADQVIDAIAQSVGVRANPAGVPLASVLQRRQLLLVLDNVEHLLDAAPDVARLLGASPALQILATGRAPLRVRGERVIPVEPLLIPDAVPDDDLAALAQVPAIALLIERAREANAQFSLTPENAAALVAICRQLDGLPLGIELAAPRLRVLAPDALLALLVDRLRVEEKTPRDVPERHRSLQAAIAWSYGLLAPRERSIFRGLSVFPGSFDLASAAATLQLDEATFLPAIEALVEQSLVQCRWPAQGELRFSLLESLRVYAAEQLRAHGEEEWTHANHAAHVLAWLEQRTHDPAQPRPPAWLDQIDLDYPNIRAALDYLARLGEIERELRLVTLLGEYWMFRGSVSEGIGHITAAIERGSRLNAGLLGGALNQCAFLHFLAGDMEAALRAGEASIPLIRRTSSANELGVALQVLAIILGSGLQRWTEAIELLREAERYQLVSNPYATSILGELYVQMGDVERGVAAIESTLPVFRAQGNWLDAGFHVLTLGMVEAKRGNSRAAAERLAESLRLMRQSGATNQALFPLTQITLLAANVALPRTTARLLGMVTRFRRQLGIELQPHSVDPMRRVEDFARAGCGDARFQAQFEAGLALPLPLALDEAIQLADLLASGANRHALEHQWDAPAGTSPEVTTLGRYRLGLTSREREVLALMARRQTDAEIADQLFISYRTVTTHVTRIIDKLGASNRRDAAALAIRSGLLDELPNT